MTLDEGERLWTEKMEKWTEANRTASDAERVVSDAFVACASGRGPSPTDAEVQHAEWLRAAADKLRAEGDAIIHAVFGK